MIDKKIGHTIEIIIIALITIISAFLTYSFLNRIDFLPEIKIIEKEKYSKLNLYIGEEEFNNKLKELNLIINKKKDIKKEKVDIINNDNIHNTTNGKKYNNINDFYKINFNGKEFLLSNDDNSYEYGFISKKIENNILYLYSHNSYKQTENSGYYLYNNLKKDNIIEFNDNYKYKVIKTDLIDLNKNEDKNIIIPKNVNIIYFTCTPYGDNIRKVYYLKKE